MIKNLAWLFVLALLMVKIGSAGADSLFLPVKGNACADITSDKTRASIRYGAYDRAAMAAVKASDYMQKHGADLDDYNYNLTAYRLVDKALRDITVITIRDDNEKICLEISGKLDKTRADEIMQIKAKPLDSSVVKDIADSVNSTLPKSMYETDETIPLLYIDNLRYYNGTDTASFTPGLTERLAFEPRVLVTETKELADYLLIPKLLLSQVEPVDGKNSRYSMSVVVEVRKNTGELVDSEQQNRYIIVENTQNMQEVAHKLLQKLLEDAVNALSGKLNRLLKY